MKRMEDVKTIILGEVDSTNSFLREYKGEEGRLMTIVTAEYQTAGRGQGTNTWESEAGCNLLFSIKTHPEGLPASRQFVMLEAMALAIKDCLSEYTDDITIKWPNDVYWRDMKISGTLSECTVSGRQIADCISGTGININQRSFAGNAPNPVSLYNITGHDTDREEVLRILTGNVRKYLSMVDAGLYDEIDRMYAAAMYRREGMFAYRDADGLFAAEIERIDPDGHLLLRRDDGRQSRYAFKEVKFILSEEGRK